jgi:hypothetical protein
MTREPAQHPSAIVPRGVAHRLRVLRLTVTRRLPLAVLLVATLAYLLAFLYALGDLTFDPAGTGITTVDDPWTRMLEPGPGPFTHEPIALVEFEAGRLFVSPLNALLGLGIAGLVGANLAVTALAIRQPTSCGVDAGTGVVAAIPALLGGSACCAPVILLVLGIQAGSLLLGLLSWLLPLGAALLILALVYLAGRIDPAVLRDGPAGTDTT